MNRRTPARSAKNCGVNSRNRCTQQRLPFGFQGVRLQVFLVFFPETNVERWNRSISSCVPCDFLLGTDWTTNSGIFRHNRESNYFLSRLSKTFRKTISLYLSTTFSGVLVLAENYTSRKNPEDLTLRRAEAIEINISRFFCALDMKLQRI